MVVRDLFQNIPEENIIARAIFEDDCKPQNLYGWITKYYAQLIKLKTSKIRKSDMMFYLSVDYDKDLKRICGDVSGFTYEDVKNGVDCYYALEFEYPRQYASLYVPDFTVQCYGEEAVAAEALREYGWNGYDDKIVCPDDMRLKVLKALYGMKTELFISHHSNYDRCRAQFRAAYEGKEVPQWKVEKQTKSEKD
jgi:hypothetical protein